MGEDKKTLGDWLYANIEKNSYLQKLYNKLVVQYTKKLQLKEFCLTETEIKHLHRFADILSKSTDKKKSSFHKNIAQNVVCILEKMYPENNVNRIYMGAVLTNVNNYVGLDGKCKDYRNPDFVEGMIETVVKESYRLPEACGNDMFFDASQEIAFTNIKNQDYYSFSGPTSMGKTFLVKMFIKEKIISRNKNNYAIVVPSKALINEVKSEMITVIGEYLYKANYKVITTPTAVMNDKKFRYIMIYTQERLSYQIKLHPDIQIDYLFIDEAQKISEVGTRSAYFYKIINYIVKKNEKIKIYFLCPYIPNPEIYLKIIPIDRKELKSDIFEFSPVNQHKSIIDLDNHRVNVYSDLTKEFIPMQISGTHATVADIVYEIGHEKSNIVYCDSKSSVEKQAIAYWKKCQKDNNPELKGLIEEIERYIHPRSFLVYFLQKGICCHVGYLPSIIKTKIEELFRRKIIKTIFCTSTLLEGVNLPADNLFIVIKNSSYILKKSADFKNLMGRVGRKTYNLVGNVYVIPEKGSSQETFDRCRELIEKPVENQKLSIDEILDDKLRDKIVKCLLNGTGALDKGKMSFETYGMARFVVNILLRCITENDTNNYIYKKFNDILTEEIVETIKQNFAGQEISDDSNVTVDQLRSLDDEIINNRISYPEVIDYEHAKEFLENLYELFQWEKYEPKTGIGKKERLSYYAVLLEQWMMGYSVRRIVDESIKYHKKTGTIYDSKEKKIVEYTSKNSQDNSIIIECLTSIEDILLFSISNYFTNFSERYKVLKNINVIENDWSEYLDFGTNDRLVIELQKIGFSREVAKIIEKEKYALLNKNGKLCFDNDIFETDDEEVLDELADVKLNYTELFMS